jgi:Xaa-Pro aminopeptidase
MRELTPDPPDRMVDPDRLERVRAAVAETDLDGLCAFAAPNSYYLSGAYAGMYSRPVVAAVTADASVLVTPTIERRKAARTAWTDRVVVYEDEDDPLGVVADALAALDADRWGYDRGRARPDWVEGVDAGVDATLHDATDTFLDLRARKTDWEVAMVRRASDLASAGVEALVDAVAVGRPELRVVNAVQDAFYGTYLERYPEYDVGTANELGQYGFASALTGARALESHSVSSSREIADGDAVVGIALPSIQGYVCEEERTVLAGDAPAEVVEAMETLVAVREETIDRVGPGESTAELDEWTAGRLRDAGYGDRLVHRTGHGEGITIHEGPALNAREPGELRPGMVISVEPGLYFEDHGAGLRHSDTLLVTDDGAERLTTTPAGVLRA